MTIKKDLEAINKRTEMEKTDKTVKSSLFISETTLRKIISDYIYKRSEYKYWMTWESEFSPIRIVVNLEEVPQTQESLGYKLLEEDHKSG